MQKSFVFDLNKCTGCSACSFACSIENDLGPTGSWRYIATYNRQRHPELPVYHLSMACCHCVDPPCLLACPARAITKDGNTGAVTINADICIGCKYCSWVCPYDAPQYSSEDRFMKKCTMCEHRLHDKRDPACVELCPTGALTFDSFIENGHIHDLSGFPEIGIKPAVNIKRLRKKHERPELMPMPLENINTEKSNDHQPKLTVKSEWSLILFSTIIAVLTGIAITAVLGKMLISWELFAAAALAAMLLSSMHLGRKFRAMRAFRNWQYSWLSREAIFVILFAISGTAAMALGEPGSAITWIAALSGFASLFAMDKIYQAIPKESPIKLHSAQMLLTAFYLTGVLSGNVLVFGWFGIFKIYLYTFRKFTFWKNKMPVRPLLSLFRLTFGFLLPFWMLVSSLESFGLYIAISVILGELIDRMEFFMETDVVSPKQKIITDMEEDLARIKRKVRRLHSKL